MGSLVSDEPLSRAGGPSGLLNPRPADEPSRQMRFGPGLLKAGWDLPLIAGMLGVAGLVDYATGTSNVEAHFYGLPIVLATWRRGWKAGLAASVIAAAINTATEWSAVGYSLPGRLLADEMVRFFVFLASVAGTAIVRRQHHTIVQQRDSLAALNQRSIDDMEAARGLQMALTRSCATSAAIEVAEYLQPARIVSGDILHISEGPGGILAILLADACGKGSPAALAGAVMLGVLQDLPSCYVSPAGTLTSLNERLFDCLPSGMFITAFYALLDPATGVLVYANAGHERPILSSERGVTELDSAGMPIGVRRSGGYADVTVRLAPSDGLFVYSDGLPDHRLQGRERVTREKVLALVAGSADKSCADLVRMIVAETVGEGVPSEDDVSLLALRYWGAAGR